MRQKLSCDQRGIAFIFELFLIVTALSVFGFAGYKVYQAKNSSKDNPSNASQDPQDSSKTQKAFEFNKDISLRLNQTATLKDGNEVIKFRFTELKPASNPKAKCEELCSAWMPTVRTEFEYAGKTFEGQANSSSAASVDMSLEANGAYPLVPYNIKLVSTDLKSKGVVRITKKEFIKAELGKQFTLRNDGIAALVPGKTGIHVQFSTCGSKIRTPCIGTTDFYVNDAYVPVPFFFADKNASPELQYASKDGSYVEQSGIRLRLLESDDKTYATFVFERS